MQHQSFVSDAEARRRYWARSVLGWRHFSRARPNPAHQALAELERTGALTGLITQNVDRLHQRAGQRRVIELHGALADVRCLHCGELEERDLLQQRLLALNPGWTERRLLPLAPRTLRKLEEMSAKVREHGMNVEPMQLAALLIEKTTEQLSEEEAEEIVRPRRRA